MNERVFKDIRSDAGPEDAKSVEDFMAELGSIEAELCLEKNLVWERVADGTLSPEYLRRLCKEYYWMGKFFTMEFSAIVSNAPDGDALLLSRSEHFEHWLQNLCDETGFTGDANHVDMKYDWAQQLGISDDDLMAYVPMPETIGAVFTSLYYMRRSYEEGLAAFGWAGERHAAGTGYAKMMYEGMRDHYGIEVDNFKVHAYAEVDHGNMADYLLRKVVSTPTQQRLVRRAVTYTFTTREMRKRALNRWLDEPGALRDRPDTPTLDR